MVVLEVGVVGRQDEHEQRHEEEAHQLNGLAAEFVDREHSAPVRCDSELSFPELQGARTSSQEWWRTAQSALARGQCATPRQRRSWCKPVAGKL